MEEGIRAILLENERICATAPYCYSTSNITDPAIDFRQQANTESISQVEHGGLGNAWLADMFGLEDARPMLQVLGNITIREERLVAFPDALHHRMHPFEVKDKTKAGHQRMPDLFLVLHPHVSTISKACCSAIEGH